MLVAQKVPPHVSLQMWQYCHRLGKNVIKGKSYGRVVIPDWFKAYPWLTLCLTKNRLFCHICRQQNAKGALSFSHNTEKAFLVDGFQNWKKANERFDQHQKSHCHREALLRKHVERQQPLSVLVDEQEKLDQGKRRKAFRIFLTSLFYLLRQGLAIRGHDNDGGNLFELMKTRNEDVDLDLIKWLKDGHYTSPQIANEIITLYGHEILRNILTDINAVGWFSVLADETTDISNKEQFNVSIRWVDGEYEIHEDPIGFVQVPNITGETLATALKDVLLRVGLPLALCRGQGYDGAANMQGKVKGLATRIEKEQPSAIRVHCLAHCLNLCLQDASRQCKPVRDAVDLVLEIVQLIKMSPKREYLFLEMKENFSPSTTGLRPLCPTRWTVKTASIGSILSNYQVLLTTLEEINSTTNDEYSRRAGGQMAMMEKFSTFFGLKLSFLIFSASEQLSRTLQGIQTSAQQAIKAVQLAREFYKSQRQEEKFNQFYDGVCSEASSMGSVGEPCLPRVKRPPRRYDDGGNPHEFSDTKAYFRKLYFETIDLMIVELKERFDAPGFDVVAKLENLLLESANGKEVSIPEKIKELYHRDIDFQKLQIQLLMLPTVCQVGFSSGVKKVTSISTITGSMASASSNAVSKAMLSEVDKLDRLYLTIPVTTATSERRFSAIRRIKTYLRSSMTQKRLNNVMLPYVHAERAVKVDVSKIANQFVTVNERRIKYFGKF